MGFGQPEGEGDVPADGGIRRFASQTLILGDELHLRLDTSVYRATVKEDGLQLVPLSRTAPKTVTVVCPQV
jgi:hypothetical protein